jgi:hypothetical protein
MTRQPRITVTPVDQLVALARLAGHLLNERLAAGEGAARDSRPSGTTRPG